MDDFDRSDLMITPEKPKDSRNNHKIRSQNVNVNKEDHKVHQDDLVPRFHKIGGGSIFDNLTESNFTTDLRGT